MNVLIKTLRLLTVQLEELRLFYTETLGLALIEESQDYFTVKVGLSELTFLRSLETNEEPFYHFAFDITNNKIQDSIQWLEERKVNLNQLSANTYLAYSRTWDSTSIYFYDPAGNILEFIARHGLSNAREGHFQSTDVLRISEIGLGVPDVTLTKKNN
jgi:catechol-2,3-dioxygenase